MTRIVILANSMQPGGRCLAGIDLDTEEWVRPVTETKTGAIPQDKCYVNGKELVVGDILECNLKPLEVTEEFQRENQLILDWNWKVSDQRFNLNDLNKFVDNTTPILHSSDEPVEISVLKDKAPSEWQSLQLVKPINSTFRYNPKKYKRWLADFEDTSGNEYSLGVTDPSITPRLEAHSPISPSRLFTVSMPTPFHSACYRVVAAVIEL